MRYSKRKRLRELLKNKMGECCYYCLQSMNFENPKLDSYATIEHLTPSWKCENHQKSDDITNLVLVHAKCNDKKNINDYLDPINRSGIIRHEIFKLRRRMDKKMMGQRYELELESNIEILEARLLQLEIDKIFGGK